MGRGSQGRGSKRQQIRELRKTRKEVQQLRTEMRAKEDRRQVRELEGGRVGRGGGGDESVLPVAGLLWQS